MKRWKNLAIARGHEPERIADTSCDTVAVPQDVLSIVGQMATIRIAGRMARETGSAPTRYISGLIDKLAESGNIKTIALVFASRGGDLDGQETLVRAIRKAGQKVRIVAVVDGLCCSAAYWAAAACHKIYASEMSEIGSIGVAAVLYDFSEAMASAGVKVNVVRSGENKSVGADGAPVGKEELDRLQAVVNELHGFFVRDVRLFRPAWDGSLQDGSVVFAERALAAGLIDYIMHANDALELLKQETEKQMELQEAVANNEALVAKLAEREKEIADLQSRLEAAQNAAKVADSKVASLMVAVGMNRTDDEALEQARALLRGAAAKPGVLAVAKKKTLAEYRKELGWKEGTVQFIIENQKDSK